MTSRWQGDDVVGLDFEGQLGDHGAKGADTIPTDLLADVVCAALAELGPEWALYNHPKSVDQAEALTQRGFGPQMLIELTMTVDEVNRPTSGSRSTDATTSCMRCRATTSG